MNYLLSVWHMIAALVGGLLVVAGVIVFSILPAGARDISELETIQAIPYASVEGRIQVYEALAHADVYINQPVVGSALRLSIEAYPHELSRLSVGVRENSFWLSYPQHDLYQADEATDQIVRRELTIPLTDKLQEPDRSVDLMFFAESNVDVPTNDITKTEVYWELGEISAEIVPQQPTGRQLIDWVLSIFKRERAV